MLEARCSTEDNPKSCSRYSLANGQESQPPDDAGSGDEIGAAWANTLFASAVKSGAGGLLIGLLGMP